MVDTLNFPAEICYNELIPFRWARVIGSVLMVGGGRVAAVVVQLLTDFRVKKGQIETLREHQRDASYNTIPSYPIRGVGTLPNRSKAEYPPICRQGLVLSR